MMRVFVDSIKRLYKKEELTLTDVKKLYASNKLTLDEYQYVLKDDSDDGDEE